jgi:hypothetical protein
VENKIIDNANKYKHLAQELTDMNIEQNMDEDVPEEIQAALIRLYYAKAFEAEIEKCEDLLDEETDEETVSAVEEAADAIESASESAYGAVEEYASEDKEFAHRIEQVTVSTEAEGLLVSLIKLYKCEGIIRDAYKCSVKFPLYGAPSSSLGVPQENTAPMDAEEDIRQRLGIDIYELLELRQRLVTEIASAIKGMNMT